AGRRRIPCPAGRTSRAPESTEVLLVRGEIRLLRRELPDPDDTGMPRAWLLMRELAEPTPQELRTAQTGAASKSRQQVDSFGIESRLCDASRHPRVIRYTVAYDNAAPIAGTPVGMAAVRELRQRRVEHQARREALHRGGFYRVCGMGRGRVALKPSTPSDPPGRGVARALRAAVDGRGTRACRPVAREQPAARAPHCAPARDPRLAHRCGDHVPGSHPR